MGLFDILRQSDINHGIEEFRTVPEAVLVDVRTPQEYSQGHIPGSINVPLHALSQIEYHVAETDVPLYVYCRSGARSSQAAGILGALGYDKVKNIGGISSYIGELAV